ncbi:hypothetical protein KSS87_004284 [Heliosperma pusillum]|nr:hypothetical protein KSS87_004284 [Heliosperma pusillum]
MKSLGKVCGIVYCLERSACDALSAHLSSFGISSAAYHAGLNNKLRSSVLDEWISSKIQGIDRKDVRIVCHFNIPKSMEAFYQESGRAGRDQLPCRSLLYYGTDDRKRMEFILRNPKSKKLDSSADVSSKKPLDDFIQMVEYCEGSGCRRKKILESFGEQAPISLCAKTCDACKQPAIVAHQLTQLTSFAARHKNIISQVVMNSSSNNADRSEFSEFWNRNDDDSRGSEEEISDSDDDTEALKTLSCSKSTSRSRLSEKFDILQRAEEKYYQNKGSQKQSQVLLTFDIFLYDSSVSLYLLLFSVDIDSSVSFLEDECYKKYGKSGKSFYISQMASTVRWLSTASLADVTKRLLPLTINHEEQPEPTSFPVNPTQDVKEQFPEPSRTDLPSTPQAVDNSEQKIVLPPVPSFSDFVRSNKMEYGKSSYSTSSKRNSADGFSQAENKRGRF